MLIISDNLSIVFCLNKQTSKDKLIMRLLKITVLERLKYKFCFVAKHITSNRIQFVIADCRGQSKSQTPSGPNHSNSCRSKTRQSSSLTVRNVVRSPLAGSTRKSYRRFINRFNDFCSSRTPSFVTLPAGESTIALFIGYSYESKYSASTTCSHLSAISFRHRLSKFPDNASLLLFSACC